MLKREIARGSLWRQWDLHVHTPASFHWTGQKFDGDLSSDQNKKLIDEMIDAMNKAQPAVFALMDYWTFDGWFALKQRLADPSAPRLTKEVFPGIELRLSAPTEKRLNAHVIFSDEIPDQHLKDFLSDLKIERTDRSVSKDALIELARATAPDMLVKKGHKKETVDTDDGDALLAGYKLAEVKADSYKNAISKVPNGLAIGFMPYDTSDGLNEVKWEEHYSYFLGLLESSPIFESRNLELRSAFLCEETDKNKKWIGNFKHGLKEIPRLVVSGSDAHCFVGVPGDNDKRGYAPSETQWWQHGSSSERDFIYVTTQNLSSEQLQALSDEVGNEQSLLVCCAAFHGVTAAKASERWPNLTLKKIPKMVLARCEWGHDDYSLNVANLPMAKVEKSDTTATTGSKSSKNKNVAPGQGGLFGENQ